MENATIASVRLANQLLLDTSARTPREIVAWMGAMQAQDFNMAKWAVGIRTPGCTEKMVQEAFDKGQILRTHVMRPTWHFVAPEDIRWMLPLSASKILSAMKSRDLSLGLTDETYKKGYRILEKALEGNKHLTRAELSAVFVENNFPMDASQLYHLMMGAEVNGLICSGAMSGKQQTYALLEERVAPVPSLSRGEALAKLARTYFLSHGPATLQDFIWWSGLSMTEARQGLEAVKAEFISEKVGTSVYWLPNSNGNVALTGEWLHLLPAFDEYIISYRDRKAVLAIENHRIAISSNGVFRPTIMRNGHTIGIWKKGSGKKNPVVPAYFEQPDPFTEDLLKKATQGFNLFLSPLPHP